MSRKRTMAALLALGLIVAACGGATPSPAGTSAALASASPMTAPTTAPTPTPELVDVADLFAGQVGSFNSGVFAFEGSVVAGPVQFLVSGTMRTQGPDSQTSMTMTVAGVETTVEGISVAGRFYQKVADGPWLEAAPPTGDGIATSLRSAAGAAFRDEGTEIRDDQVVHRLVSSGGSTFDPAVFLASASGVSNASGQYAFFVTEDGTPVGAEVEARWTQADGNASVDASMAFTFQFSQLGLRQVIRTPADVWQPSPSSRWGYTIAVPRDFDYDKDKRWDYYIGPGDSHMLVGRMAHRGMSLNVFAKGVLTELKRELKAKSGTNEAITLDGANGRLLTVSGRSADFGGKVTFYEAIVVKGKYVYLIAWFGPTAAAEADLATFRLALATFAFSD